ncbi:MAG TPA: hypothetical protein VE262_12190 [Blastocatellia bacterium]|nr:hypothetical protein [Blastocatellia bacterium]
MKRSRSLNAFLFICVTTIISSDPGLLAAGQFGAAGRPEPEAAPLSPAGGASKRAEASAGPPISRVGLRPSPGVVLFEMSRINVEVIREFKKVWRISGLGINNVEGFVRVLLRPDGTYEAQSLGMSNEFKKFTFKWDPQTVAIAHTHPNNNDPRPSGQDLDLSNRFRIPIFTLTNRGMYMYDPLTRKITLVHQGLDWLNPSKWASVKFV